ncbi:MAG: twin-arginine translocation signal domain-containing protein [Planctomycetes bacterium]|nr:twin-arginine translocation signal domain-containing protein [Planctomycetota bacterium]
METRRKFLKKLGAYAAPLVLTVAVRPAHAANGYNPPDGGNGGGSNGDAPRRWCARRS